MRSGKVKSKTKKSVVGVYSGVGYDFSRGAMIVGNRKKYVYEYLVLMLGISFPSVNTKI